MQPTKKCARCAGRAGCALTLPDETPPIDKIHRFKQYHRNFYSNDARATAPVLKLGKEENNFICPSSLNFALRRDKLGIYTLQNSLELFRKLTPPEGYKECVRVCFVLIER